MAWGLASPRKLSPLRHRTIYAPVEVTITPIRQGRSDCPGGIATLACRAMDCIRMLVIGTDPEDIVMLGGGTIPECLARRGVVHASKPRRDTGTAIGHIATMRGVMGPDIAGDVNIGVV